MSSFSIKKIRIFYASCDKVFFHSPPLKRQQASHTEFVMLGRETNENEVASAHKVWDHRWSTKEGRSDWVSPEKEVTDLAEELHNRRSKTLLDLGCGVGRHSLFFASRGFTVFATDASLNGLKLTEKVALEAGYSIDIRQSHMTHLPYPDDFFDYVLAWNVIYHGTPDIVKRSINEILRVLRPGGLFQGTMLSKKDSYHGMGRRIDVDTYVMDTGDEEKSHPHFYCGSKDLLVLFKGFEIISLRLCEQKRPGSFHWNMLWEKCR